MVRVLVWGFDSQSTELIKSKKIKIVHWIGKNHNCTVHRKKIYDADIPYHLAPKDAHGIYSRVYKYYFNSFIKMTSRHDRTNKKAVYDYNDLFHIYFNYFYNIYLNSKIDCFIISCIPHAGSDYLAYILAKELNIKTVIFYQSIIPNRYFYFYKN